MRNWGSELGQIPVSYPVRVNLAGYESDTHRLQKAGWALSVRNVEDRGHGFGSIELAMQHRALRLHAITHPLSLRDLFFARPDASTVLAFFSAAQFNVAAIAPEIQMQIMTTPSASAFTAIDATPQWGRAERVDLSKLGMFRTLAVSEELDFYVPEKSVAELLEIIRQKQEPIQAEIREKHRRSAMRDAVRGNLDGFEPPREIRGQIISIDSRFAA